MKYRPEIDGMRAIAVVSVIMFHAGFGFVSGGFVGVDVFFVISGFLITTILINDLQQARFSITRFYERRARRILPALFTVIFASIVPAWILFLPQEFNDFSKSIVAVILFVSNVLFWRQSGYFDTTAAEKPLLHTWSLGVEEQYYLLFPIFLFLLWRYERRWIVAILAATVFGSLALSIWTSTHLAAANFYLLPTRAWQILIGSIAAMITTKLSLPRSDIAAGLGLSAVVFAIFFFNSELPLPGPLSLLPVLGTALILLFSDKDTRVGRLLGSSVPVRIGLISYSAYLWHQPIFAFAHVWIFDALTNLTRLALVVLSLVLAYLSWHFVEKPYRSRDRVSLRALLLSLGAGAIVLTIVGALGVKTNGFEALRFSNDERAILQTAAPSPLRSTCHFPQNKSALTRTACLVVDDTEPGVAVIGNSHAVELAYALGIELAPRNIGVIQYSISNCPHNFGYTTERGTICYDWHEAVVDTVTADKRVSDVVLSYRNDYFMDNKAYLRALEDMVTAFLKADKNVTIVLQAPVLKRPISSYLRTAKLGTKSTVGAESLEEWRARYAPVRSFVDGILSRLPDSYASKLLVFDPANFFCDETQCYAALQGRALYFDDNHMSVSGAEIISQKIASSIKVP